MRRHFNFSASAVVALIVSLLPAGLAAPQQSPFPRRDRDAVAEPPDLKRAREKAMNEKRQEDLRRDADKLFKLATQLKTQVDKTNENVLSLEVIKKAEEIEKLARSVKDKMKAQGMEPMVSPSAGADPPGR